MLAGDWRTEERAAGVNLTLTSASVFLNGARNLLYGFVARYRRLEELGTWRRLRP